MHLKIVSALVVCFIYLLTLLTNVSVNANSEDPDQTAPTLFDQEASETLQLTTKEFTCVVIGALRVNCMSFFSILMQSRCLIKMRRYLREIRLCS